MKNPLTFSGIRHQAYQNSQNIRNVRSFGKRKLTNSGIYSYSGIFPNERALRVVEFEMDCILVCIVM